MKQEKYLPFIFIFVCIMPNTNLPLGARKDIAAAATRVENKIHRLIIQTVFDELLKMRKPLPNGTLTCVHGAYPKTINKYHEIGHTWLKRRQLTYLMEAYLRSLDNTLHCDDDIPSIIDNSVSQDVLTITDVDVDNNFNIVNESKGGRPKGSTCAAKLQYQQIIQKAMTDAAILYQQKKREAELEGKNVSKYSKGNCVFN